MVLIAPLRFFLTALVALAVASGVARAHPSFFTQAHVVIAEDGSFTLALHLDLLALAADVPAAEATDTVIKTLLAEPPEKIATQLAEAAEFLHRETVLRTDRGPAKITTWTVPDLTAVQRALDPGQGASPTLPWMGEITGAGRLPDGATSVSLRTAFVVGKIVTVFERASGEPYGEPMEAGDFSSVVPLNLTPGADTRPGALALFGRYVVIGFEHILPKGLDHILFVLGLFFLGSRLKPLLWQVSAFTVAHSITLGLALYGVVRVPAAVVEPIIAASIAFIAIENLFTAELKPWRPLVVFGFGLIHGLGFAGALAEVGLVRENYALGLIGFNVGVEAGQLAVITAAFLLVGWARHRARYRRVVVLPASTLITLVALFWTAQRVFG